MTLENYSHIDHSARHDCFEIRFRLPLVHLDTGTIHKLFCCNIVPIDATESKHGISHGLKTVTSLAWPRVPDPQVTLQPCATMPSQCMHIIHERLSSRQRGFLPDHVVIVMVVRVLEYRPIKMSSLQFEITLAIQPPSTIWNASFFYRDELIYSCFGGDWWSCPAEEGYSVQRAR